MQKNHFTALCASASLAVLMACSGQVGETKSYNQGINIIPMPQTLVQQQGSFKLSSSTKIAATTPEAKTVAEYFITKMNRATGFNISVAESGEIQLVLDPALDLGEEAYKLDVTASGVQVTAKTPHGL